MCETPISIFPCDTNKHGGWLGERLRKEAFGALSPSLLGAFATLQCSLSVSLFGAFATLQRSLSPSLLGAFATLQRSLSVSLFRLFVTLQCSLSPSLFGVFATLQCSLSVSLLGVLSAHFRSHVAIPFGPPWGPEPAGSCPHGADRPDSTTGSQLQVFNCFSCPYLFMVRQAPVPGRRDTWPAESRRCRRQRRWQSRPVESRPPKTLAESEAGPPATARTRSHSRADSIRRKFRVGPPPRFARGLFGVPAGRQAADSLPLCPTA